MVGDGVPHAAMRRALTSQRRFFNASLDSDDGQSVVSVKRLEPRWRGPKGRR